MSNNSPIFAIFNDLIDKLSAEHKAFSELLKNVRMLAENNVFVSGGVVRNALTGSSNKVKDIDLFLTDEAFDGLSSFLKKKGDLQSNQFGTYRWFPITEPGLYYDIIPISAFYNGLWKCRDIIDALNQFDITANAVAFDLANGNFYNPQNGYDDINKRILRAIRFDYPELIVSNMIPISRNSVLWFRYYHYAYRLGFTIEPITFEWLKLNKFRIKDLELFKNYFFDPIFPNDLD